MRLSRVTAVAVCVLALASSAGAACGGGSSGTTRPDTSKVPTATLPPTLPEPTIVGSGAIQPGGGTSYTVKDGDTLAGIAARFGVSLEDLRAANPNVESSSLSIGQSIRLPAASEAPPAAAATAVSTRAAAPTEGATAAATATEAAPIDTPVPAATPTAISVGQTYTVLEGDIPVTIAQKFGITVEELLAANPGIDPTGLKIGQVLIVPPKRQE